MDSKICYSRRNQYNYELIDDDLAKMVSDGARTVEAIHSLQIPGSIARKRASSICDGRNLRYTIPFLVTPDEIAKMRELAEQGMNFSEIAVRTERSDSTVAKYVKAKLTPEQIWEARQTVGRVKRICPNCQCEYETSDSFCSDECYHEWRSKQGLKRPPNRFYCAKCGKFVDDSGMKTRFCSARCERLYYKHPRKKGALLYEKNIVED